MSRMMCMVIGYCAVLFVTTYTMDVASALFCTWTL